jgi:hypothetical protein
MTMDAPRTREQRMQDTLKKLHTEADVWVATADEHGAPYLVPLSMYWDGRNVVICAAASSRTMHNVLRTGEVRLGLGSTRDVVMIDGRLSAPGGLGSASGPGRLRVRGARGAARAGMA